MLKRVVLVGILATSFSCSANARSGREGKWDDVAEGRPTGPPAMAVVAVKEQRVTIYDAQGPILRAPVSTGRKDYDTPVGVFSVLQKEAEHYSNRYDDASMPFMQRITWSGIALHAGALPGSPASHGCIRLPYGFAEKLFGITKLGMRVIIARTDVAPAFVSHPSLLQPNVVVGETHLLVPTSDQPSTTNPARQTGIAPELSSRLAALQADTDAKKTEADAASRNADQAAQAFGALNAESDKALKSVRAAEDELAMTEAELSSARAGTSSERIQRAEERMAKANSKLTEVRERAQPAIDAALRAKEAADAAAARKLAASDAAKDAKRKLSPVSIFVSLKSQRLYVRQAFEPVMDVPISILDPDRPIGTHVFTAVDYEPASGLRWTAISLGAPASLQSRSDATPNADVTAAIAALDRITIPKEVGDRFVQSNWLGSSLIISDEDLNKETGPATDFIVVSSTDPQGGLIMRKPDAATLGRASRGEGNKPYSRPEPDFIFRHPFGAF
jgi:hypothetical protein